MKKPSWATDPTTPATAETPTKGEDVMEKEKNNILPPWAHYFKVNVRDLGLEVLLSMVPDIAVHLVNGIEAIKEKFDALKLPLPEEIRTSLTGPIEKAVELLGIKPAVTPTPSPAPVPPAATTAAASVVLPKATPAPVAPAPAPATPPKKAPATPPALPVATTAPAVKAVAKPAPATKAEPPKATPHAAATKLSEPASAASQPVSVPYTSVRARVAAAKIAAAAEPATEPKTIAAAPAPTTRVATLVPKDEPRAARRVVPLAPAPKAPPRLCQYRKDRDDREGCSNEAKLEAVACTEHSTPCPTCQRNLVPVWMADRPMVDRKTRKRIRINGNEVGSHCHDCAAQIFKNYLNPDWDCIITQPNPEQIQADKEYDVDFYEKLRAAEPATDPEPTNVDDKRDGGGDPAPMIDATDVVVIDDGDGEPVYCDYKGGIPLANGADENGEFSFDDKGKCLMTGATLNKKKGKNFCSRHQSGKVRGSDMETANRAKKGMN